MLASWTERQNHLDLLENGLRNIMRRNDLDWHLGDGLDKAAMERAQIHLESLCALMERSVDPGALRHRLQVTTDKYCRLDALLF
ncbi:hypothetical protein ABW19_dt0201217 [Dactylella cylindrospora]|nr:hypothetical protein ABW19_dt0201217 [Dactylella cylindrospora]